MSLASLLDSRLVMVTGKGGTGKSTYAAALGLLSAVRGKRTLICEIDSQMPALEPIFGREVPFEPVDVLPNLAICNVRWAEALEAYMRRALPMRRLVRMVLENRLVARFMDITPGSREVVILSRVHNLLEQYDLVLVDMPASGHAFSLLDVLRSLLALFRSGPVRQRALEIREMVHASTTRMAFVALPEDMVVNETIETYQKMRRADLLGGPPALFVNGATLPSLTDDERALIQRLSTAELDPVQAEFVRAGVWEDRLEQATAEARDRLGEVLGTDPILVPPAGGGGVPRRVVGSVAVHLGRLVGITRRDLPWT